MDAHMTFDDRVVLSHLRRALHSLRHHAATLVALAFFAAGAVAVTFAATEVNFSAADALTNGVRILALAGLLNLYF
jgi:hypothetical protein